MCKAFKERLSSNFSDNNFRIRNTAVSDVASSWWHHIFFKSKRRRQAVNVFNDMAIVLQIYRHRNLSVVFKPVFFSPLLFFFFILFISHAIAKTN